MSYRILEEGHISSPRGFRATGVACGLKDGKARDLALIASQQPCRAAALFTSNAVRAAPVLFDEAILARNREGIRAVLINTGHANAATGKPGLADAVECAKLVAEELEIPRDSVLLMSAGAIGARLPMAAVRQGIRRAASELDSGGGRRAALALPMAGERPKQRALVVSLREGRDVILAGIARGGQVHPGSSALLCLITTDAALDPRLLARSLTQSAGRSFARLALAGEPGPNDSLIALANGASGLPPIVSASAWEYGAWQEALDALCEDLARQIARDAAAGSVGVRIHVQGAADEAAARQIALNAARSALLRRACARHEPDWGALLVAVGASGADMRPELIELRLDSVVVLRDGLPVAFDSAAAARALAGPEIDLVVDLHMGHGNAMIWTCIAPTDG